MSEETLFIAALEFADPAERTAFLDRACSGIPDLRARMDNLLAWHAQAGSFLANSPALLPTGVPGAPGRDSARAAHAAGGVVGPYELVEVIGEGGMGTVWLARQQEPVKRLVAVKVIKAGMDSKAVLTRFEAERQALALMDHPSIAKVLDAGTTPDGRPFFVMELVRGVTITKFCDDGRLTPRERLELFVSVCRAVQHAHQKGVIHRDLKPSNVLVALYDGRPVPKVIDFGVAKAAGQPLTEETLITGLGAVVGTPEYMSPEQSELNQLDVDTRSDVYSLGVLLYELLTGTTPLQRKRVKEAALLEVLRLVREEEPPRPSTRLSTTDELPSIAACRGVEPKKLSGLLRGELDWIVMKALEKDRNRRYETASGFARDVERYLADEPVQACPPSAGYRLRKFARRNRMRLAVAVLVLFLLTLLGGGAGWAVWDRSSREAESARQRGERQAKVAGQVESILAEADRLEREQNWPEAVASARRAEAVAAGDEVDAATRERVRDQLKGLEFVNRLEQIRMDRGTVRLEQADRDYARAFRDYGVDVDALPVEVSVERLRARSGLAVPFAAALDHWVTIRKARAGSFTRLTAVARGVDPEPLRDRLRSTWGRPITPGLRDELRRLADSIDLRVQPAETIVSLSAVLKRANHTDAALRVLREARSAYPGDYWINLELAAALYERRDLEGAVRFGTAAVAIRPGSAMAHHNLGIALRAQKRLDESVASFRTAVVLDPMIIRHYTELGYTLGLDGKPGEGLAVYQEALGLQPDNVYIHHALGCFLRDVNRDNEGAIRSFRKAIDLDSNYVRTSAIYTDLLFSLGRTGRLDEAVAVVESLRKEPAEKRHPLLAQCLNLVARFLVIDANPARRDPERAMILSRQAVDLEPRDGSCLNTHGIVLYRTGDWKTAIETLESADQFSGGKLFGYNAYYIAMSHWHLGARGKAREWYDRAVDWSVKTQQQGEDLRRFRAEAAELLGVKDE